MYLVDTTVVSESAPSCLRAPAALLAWMDRNADILYLSTITVAEIEAAISKARRQAAARRADEIAHWLEHVLHLYGNRVLPLAIETARSAGALADKARSLGKSPGFEDVVIAATAKVRTLTVLTRNLKHFAPLGVRALNPFERLP